MMILTIFLLLFLAYILSTMGRRGHPVLDELRTWHYAHRGLHDETVPENSMEAFSTALVHGYGAELDVHKIDVSYKSAKGEILVCKDGLGLAFDEDKAKAILLESEIEILVSLSDGNGSAEAYGCDLTYDYVKINGDYRT